MQFVPLLAQRFHDAKGVRMARIQWDVQEIQSSRAWAHSEFVSGHWDLNTDEHFV